MHPETYYPGLNSDQQLNEYEKVKNFVNKKYGTKNTSLEIRAELEEAYNKIFDKMLQGSEDKVFQIIWVMMDFFNIDEVKAVRYLNKKNYEFLRKHVVENKNTLYYQKIEKALQEKKVAKKELKMKRSIKTIMDLFE